MSNKVVLGQNDLETTHPEVAKSWNRQRNGELSPAMFHAGSHQIVWWVCEEGHETQSEIRVRAKGHRCAICANRVVLAGFNDLATTHPELAIEFDVELNSPIEVTQIQAGSKPKYWWKCSSGHSFSTTVATRIKSVGCPICLNKKVLGGYNDLATTNPSIAAKWHPTRNAPLTSSDVVAGSDKKVWWTCDQGHEYESSVYNKCKNPKCPVCSKILLVSGVNDLRSTHAGLANQWHPVLNGELRPENVTSINSDLVWWKCPEGHEYQLQVKLKVKSQGCSVCSNARFMPGVNDLQSRFPEIAKRWHPTLNGGLTSRSISPMSKKKVWWTCSKDSRHQFLAEVQAMVFGGGCSICSGHQVQAGINDLATLAPEQAHFWNSSKNGELKPTQISPQSSKKVWWICDFGHETFASPGSRTSKGVKCAVCSGKKVLAGFNDLATTHPEIAKKWHPSKNNKLNALDVNFGSGKKVWWQCQDDPRHEYESRVYDQTSHLGNGCPICVGRLVIQGLNDLTTVAPELMQEWNLSKNTAIAPTTLSLGSDKKVWWICEQGHEWRSSVKNRTLLGSGCPRCTRSGYDPSLPGLFYFIENKTLLARKVGVTNPGAKNKRTDQFRKFGWEMVYSVTSENGYLILDIETAALRWIRKDLGLPRYLDSVDMNHMGGASETFSGFDPSNEQVIAKIEMIQTEIEKKHS